MYPCIEEASNDEDIVVISKDDTDAMREICFLVEDNEEAKVPFANLTAAVES